MDTFTSGLVLEATIQRFARLTTADREVLLPELRTAIMGTPNIFGLLAEVVDPDASGRAEAIVDGLLRVKYEGLDGERPFVGTGTVVILGPTGRVLANVKRLSERLEALYGDLTRFATVKALMALHEALKALDFRLSEPSANLDLRRVLGPGVAVHLGGAARFVLGDVAGVSGWELTESAQMMLADGQPLPPARDDGGIPFADGFGDEHAAAWILAALGNPHVRSLLKAGQAFPLPADFTGAHASTQIRNGIDIH